MPPVFKEASLLRRFKGQVQTPNGEGGRGRREGGRVMLTFFKTA